MTLSIFHSNWWVLALRGLAAVLFGLLTFLLPGLTLLVLVSLFGGYCLVNGLLTLVAAFRRSHHQPRWWALALEGVFSLLAGVLTLAWPGLTSLSLLYAVALWSIVTGALQIGTAIRLRKQLTNEWVLLLGGLLSIGFGVLLAFAPVTGALVVSWWIGTYAFVFGILLSILAFRLRRQPAQAAVSNSNQKAVSRGSQASPVA